jgi:hypothetical protein
VFYGNITDGVPWFAYDGLWDAWPYNTYQSKMLQRAAIATPVTLQVGAQQIGTYTYRIQLRACLEPSASALSARLNCVIVQDYYPASPTYCRNTFRAATTPSTIQLTPGHCYYETRDITLDATYTPANLGIIAWAQTPNAAYPAEVYQAAKDMWPFAAVPNPGDLNCDNVVSFADINPFVQALTDPAGWQAAYPNCPALNGDVNGSGAVGFDDINPFVTLLTTP